MAKLGGSRNTILLLEFEFQVAKHTGEVWDEELINSYCQCAKPVKVKYSVISQYKYTANRQAVMDFHCGLMVSAWAPRFVGKCHRWFDPS